MPLYIAKSGDLDRCYRCLTDSLTLKDGATQLLIKYKRWSSRNAIIQSNSESWLWLQGHYIESQKRQSSKIATETEERSWCVVGCSLWGRKHFVTFWVYGGSFVIAPHKTPLKQDHIVLSSSYILRPTLLDNVPNTPNVAQKNSILGTQV